VYNVAPYLARALDSILAQTYTDFELVLINDGSTDKSGEIIEKYRKRDRRIVVNHKDNEGVARTLNRGLGMARGEYIRRFDADDTCLPTALERQVRFLEDHPEVALVGTQQAFQTDRGKVAWNVRVPHDRYFDGKPYRMVSPADFYERSPIVHGTVLMRRSLIADVGGYRPEFLTSEDNDLWLRVCERYPVAVLNDCSYFLRLHATSATRQHAASRRLYRDLALAFHEERLCLGTDPLQRGEPMPLSPAQGDCDETAPSQAIPGMTVHPQLDFMYRLLVDAGDWVNAFRLARQALTMGWRRPETYRLLTFPLLGERLVRQGVKVKALLRGRGVS
jgi:glycosyltransferase involved in cell wall biosynthesis